MLKSYGHQNVQILNGGLSKWKHDKYPLNCMPYEEYRPKQDAYSYQFTDSLYADKSFVKKAIADLKQNQNNSSFILVDLRTSQEFKGEESSPTLIPGSIPQAINIPSRSLSYRLFNTSQSSILYNNKEIPKNKLVIVYCQTGVRASVGAFLFNQMGYKVKLYDRSYMEWGRYY